MSEDTALAVADDLRARGFSTDDTFNTSATYVSAVAASNPYRSYEWYLDGGTHGESDGVGANVDAISIEYSGRGARIGIIDEGFDVSHPDLQGHFDLSLSYDPRDHGATDIRPDSTSDVHGTWVSGVIGASADNGTGIVGVAPGATLAGFYARFGGDSSRAEIANLLARQVNVDISNNSWGYTAEFSDNFLDPSWAAIKNALTLGTEQGRGGLGTVYVFAAGNDRAYVSNTISYDGDNTNYHSLTNSRLEITVAASTEDGHIASFSTPGASVFVTAPGDSILTTSAIDSSGHAAHDFAFVSGTSFATPIVSGVIAMMLEANANLGYRDVQDILALSSHKIDADAPGWAANGATNWNGGGNLVSHDFGFGLVDAHAAVRLAETWTTQHTADNEEVITINGDVGSNTTLVDFQPVSYTATVPTSFENFSIEWVEVDVSLLHGHDGDLRIHLISPTGTDSLLVDMPAAGNNTRSNLNFTFSTNHDWGESPVGNWTLQVEDAGTGGTGSMVSYAFRFYGSSQGNDDTYYYTDDFSTSSGARSTLSDTSGIDTINAAAVTSASLLDLSAGSTSMIDGRVVQIAAGSAIENAYGGDGSDILIGNAAANRLFGGHGNDIIGGGAGSDVLNGGADADRFVFDNTAIADARSGIFDRIADYAALQGDQIDLSAIFSTLYSHGVGPAAAAVVQAVEDVGGSFANLRVDLDGAANGANWLTVARLDGMHTGNTLNIVLDASTPAGSTILVDAAPATSNPPSEPTTPTPTQHESSGPVVYGGHGDVMWAIGEGHVNFWQIDGTQLQSSGTPVAMGAEWNVIQVGDFSGYGHNDLMWRDGAGTVAVWGMSGLQVQSAAIISPLGTDWHLVDTADFDGNQTSDALWRADDGAVAIWGMNGTQVQYAGMVSALGTNWQLAAAADFNGDGKSDILWQDADGTVAMWEMNGTTAQHAAIIGAIGTNWHLISSADFGGDGKADLLWRNDQGDLAIWGMNGMQVASATMAGSIATTWDFVGAADFNGNGTNDILWRDDDGTIAIWNMDYNTHTSTDTIAVGTDWHIVDLHDSDADGMADILLRNDDGSVAVWHGGEGHVDMLGALSTTGGSVIHHDALI